MATATSAATSSPPRPNSDPTSSTSAVIPPRSSAVFRPFICLCTFHPSGPRTLDPTRVNERSVDGVPGVIGTTRRRSPLRRRKRQDHAMAIEVRTETTDRVAVLTVSNPERRNAMNLELSGKLVEALDACRADDGVGAVVITGEDPAFCAGGDLGELATADPAVLHRVYAGFLAVAEHPLPTVAAVNGAAVGAGLNLALACDIRLAGPRARFDARFLPLGLHPGGGYTWMAQRVLGYQRAAAMTLFGEVVDAEEAARIGLV